MVSLNSHIPTQDDILLYRLRFRKSLVASLVTSRTQQTVEQPVVVKAKQQVCANLGIYPDTAPDLCKH